ncbi:hypothetical protein JTE90_024894 [Oedothorax gibbosus]|uniref:Fibronectin type-III domain-containing protein n=1 Tax=Oedothorax gibbosus TaxID=931172 RepID=A0AAV6V2F8_9ARAC|nr:hypothetical protein JTE90_024894 [Oedothorax gibbosus]
MAMAMYALGLFFALFLNVAQNDANECNIQTKGVDASFKNLILNTHNEKRSKMATGQEPGFPKCADMLELVWDDKLAEMAQKWASKCELIPDPITERETDEGLCGQNFASTSNQIESPNWKEFFEDINKEVKDFECQAIQKYYSDTKTSRFTQMIWAKTHKVGCGYVRFQSGENYTHLYGCHYFPSANVVNKPIYEFGLPCSKCGGCGSYVGLCKIGDSTTVLEDTASSDDVSSPAASPETGSSATDSSATDSSATDSSATDSSATDSSATDSSATDSSATDSSTPGSSPPGSSATSLPAAGSSPSGGKLKYIHGVFNATIFEDETPAASSAIGSFENVFTEIGITTAASPETGSSATDSSATDSSATDSSETGSSATDSSATDSTATDSSATDSSATDSSTPGSSPPGSSATSLPAAGSSPSGGKLVTPAASSAIGSFENVFTEIGITTAAPPETGSSATDSSATDSSATDSSETGSSATDSSATDSTATDSTATDSSATDSSAIDSSTPGSSPPGSSATSLPAAGSSPSGGKHKYIHGVFDATISEDESDKPHSKDVPTSPVGVSTVIISTRFVTLSWSQPQNTNGEIIAYSVYYKETTSTRERVLNTTQPKLEEVNIQGLQPSTKYHFRIVAYNEHGPGDSSEEVIVDTQSEAPAASSAIGSFENVFTEIGITTTASPETGSSATDSSATDSSATDSSATDSSATDSSTSGSSPPGSSATSLPTAGSSPSEKPAPAASSAIGSFENVFTEIGITTTASPETGSSATDSSATDSSATDSSATDSSATDSSTSGSSPPGSSATSLPAAGSSPSGEKPVTKPTNETEEKNIEMRYAEKCIKSFLALLKTTEKSSSSFTSEMGDSKKGLEDVNKPTKETENIEEKNLEMRNAENIIKSFLVLLKTAKKSSSSFTSEMGDSKKGLEDVNKPTNEAENIKEKNIEMRIAEKTIKSFLVLLKTVKESSSSFTSEKGDSKKVLEDVNKPTIETGNIEEKNIEMRHAEKTIKSFLVLLKTAEENSSFFTSEIDLKKVLEDFNIEERNIEMRHAETTIKSFLILLKTAEESSSSFTSEIDWKKVLEDFNKPMNELENIEEKNIEMRYAVQTIKSFTVLLKTAEETCSCFTSEIDLKKVLEDFNKQTYETENIEGRKSEKSIKGVMVLFETAKENNSSIPSEISDLKKVLEDFNKPTNETENIEAENNSSFTSEMGY